MRERILRHDPNKVCGSLDILGERAFVRERRAVYEAGDVVAHFRAGDVLADLDDVPGEVASVDRSWGSDEVHVCSPDRCPQYAKSNWDVRSEGTYASSR